MAINGDTNVNTNNINNNNSSNNNNNNNNNNKNISNSKLKKGLTNENFFPDKRQHISGCSTP